MVDACDFLSIDKAVIQGAMGAVARHDLVVGVSQAGGLGTLSYLPPDAFELELQKVQESLGPTTFAANLLLPIVRKGHVEACLRSDVPVVSLFFGFDQNLISALKDAGKRVLFQIGSVEEAKRVIAAGADGVIVQGLEAGGHVRSTTRLADLLPQVKDAFPDHLVCGAGGIHDAASADACRNLGADAVCSGTRFLASPEASAHAAYKAQLIEASETVLTNLFGMGWRDPHRVVPNAAVKRWCGPGRDGPAWLPLVHHIAGILSKVSSPDRAAAMTAGQTLEKPLYTPSSLTPEMDEALLDVVALYAGECVQHIHDLKPVAESVDALA